MVSKKLIFSIAFIRAIGCIGVIILHVVSPLITSEKALSYEWWVGNIFSSLVRFSVPIFVMSSGALILPKFEAINRTRNNQILKSRFFKLLKPLIAWSIIYLTLNILQKDLINSGEVYDYIFDNLVIKGAPHFHLWYLYMLTGLYFISPLLSKITKSINFNILKIRISYIFLFLSILFLSLKLLELDEFNSIAKSIFYIPYFLSGHLIFQNKDRFLKYKLRGLFTFLVFWIFIFLSIAFLYPFFNNLAWEIMYANLNPLVIIMSVSLFVFLINLKPKSYIFNKIIENISKHSLGIYVIHPIFVVGLRSLGISAQNIGNVHGVLLTASLIFYLSFLSSILISRNKYLKFMVQT